MVLILFYRCAYHKDALGAGETKELKCIQSVTGRYVFVMLKVKDYLTLCEVQVFGVQGMCFLPYDVYSSSTLY